MFFEAFEFFLQVFLLVSGAAVLFLFAHGGVLSLGFLTLKIPHARWHGEGRGGGVDGWCAGVALSEMIEVSLKPLSSPLGARCV